MSILIKGAKMPKNCHECKFKRWTHSALKGSWFCPLRHKFISTGVITQGKRYSDCPLVEVPSDNVTEDMDKALEKYTICGYAFKELAVFADACRKKGITETEMANFCRNVTDAYNYIVEECQKQFDAAILKTKEQEHESE